MKATYVEGAYDRAKPVHQGPENKDEGLGTGGHSWVPKNCFQYTFKFQGVCTRSYLPNVPSFPNNAALVPGLGAMYLYQALELNLAPIIPDSEKMEMLLGWALGL